MVISRTLLNKRILVDRLKFSASKFFFYRDLIDSFKASLLQTAIEVLPLSQPPPCPFTDCINLWIITTDSDNRVTRTTGATSGARLLILQEHIGIYPR